MREAASRIPAPVSRRPWLTALFQWRFNPQSPILPIVSVALLLLAWSLLSRYVVNPIFLPPPTEVLREAIEMLRSGELQRHVGASLNRILLGYSNGAFWAILIGALAGRFFLARGLLLPIVNLLRPISPTALVPLMIIWFGIGEFSKVLLVGYTTFISVFFNTISGVAGVPLTRERAARTLGASGFDVLRLVVFPSAIPYILTGMRIGLGLSFMSVVAAELIAADAGIGFLIMQSRFSMLTVRMFVGLASLGVIGFTADWIFRRLIRRFGGPYVGRELSHAF